MSVLQTIQSLLDACEEAGTHPYGFLCSPGVLGSLKDVLNRDGVTVDYGEPFFRDEATPDMYVHGLPLWCIPGYPPGRIDAVSRAAVIDALEFCRRVG